ncbi:TPA: small, acid-soluble spore protein, alpha/beta type [Bacillus cereus]|uniref:alpha/beta-type small acid-soluble spore protein n=1 Tax=Bacillus TaxID=1386 RepID=UPI00088CB3B2|nr:MULTISPECIES: alpha/beta-type small acid-soluble spore protein [Bacillus]MBL3782113.1 alpha/beta-type small acid-soluble spore protein [Bacillus cereus]MBL3800657.1 alpha/beta-type small acid-soluble spore protein [Bacillus cereus]MBL3813434.1 alpha/beta-type small acid-soluble spore protein [Bacillus cereus]MCU5251827.1 alpha/beta-type small acid-soluble spore protein [Bacillus cereus]MDZ4428410.1 alpha/beta-type small acid-soluble spore protein [Bacillus cereus]
MNIINTRPSDDGSYTKPKGPIDPIGPIAQEVAREFGVHLGAETTSRANGSVGGEITKRLVAIGLQKISGTSEPQPIPWKVLH